jgi:hypothetical protein
MSFLVGGVREDRFKTPLSGNPPSNPATAADPNDVSNAERRQVPADAEEVRPDGRAGPLVHVAGV